MTRRTPLCLTLATLLWLSGCAVLRPDPPSAVLAPHAGSSELRRVSYLPQTHDNEPSCLHRGIEFILDGAGGFEAVSKTVGSTIDAAKLSLDIRTFHWTHGYCRVFSDQMHGSHCRREGRKLADLVLSCRQEAPNQPIYLLAHSAGSCVALVAAEELPPNSLERIVLLAPAVSSKRDLRGALRSSCQGIDVFISSHDWCYLGLGTMLTGTTDRCWTAGAAGRVGFQPIVAGPEDDALYAKLRQYPWDPNLMWTGHKGGHYGAYQPGFLRAFVFPLLQK